jgi:site-specific DNA recombinase
MSGREEASLPEQRERIDDACEREGLELLRVTEEPDVSGYKTPLDHRAGLMLSLEAVEAGKAEVVVAAYLDRLFRNTRVQHEFVERVERAGGSVLAVDAGKVSNGSATTWLTSGMLGMVAEFQARQGAEKTRAGLQAAIDRGHPPWRVAPLGYRKVGKGLEPDPETAPLRAEMLRMRVAGKTVVEIREHLRRRGIKRSPAQVSHLLASRDQLGELHHGSGENFEPNLRAWEPIVERELWEAAQRVRIPRGRKSKSERLLARLGVLRCGSCGSRMSIGISRGSYRFYRCVNVDCTHRQTIGAEKVEGIVTAAVRDYLSGIEGRASVEQNRLAAERALEGAQARVDAAARVLDPLEPAEVERLRELKEARDAARDHLDSLGPVGPVRTVSVADWDDLTLDERRDLIRAAVESVTVSPGRGPDRVSVRLVGD